MPPRNGGTVGKHEGKRRGRPTSLARQLADDFMGSSPAKAPGRLALDADVARMPDDPAVLKLLIGDLQFENALLKGIIDHGGGATYILSERQRP